MNYEQSLNKFIKMFSNGEFTHFEQLDTDKRIDYGLRWLMRRQLRKTYVPPDFIESEEVMFFYIDLFNSCEERIKVASVILKRLRMFISDPNGIFVDEMQLAAILSEIVKQRGFVLFS